MDTVNTEPANIESVCIRPGCGQAISNCAADGRPDAWFHIDPAPTDNDKGCYQPIPPHDVAAALPTETRQVRVRAQEYVIYEFDVKIPVHVGVTGTMLSDYLDADHDLWADHLTEENIFNTTERELVHWYTYYLDDKGYLEALANAVNDIPGRLTRWLTSFCPVCSAQPDSDDATHQTVTTEPADDGTEPTRYVAIACDGSRVVDPNALRIKTPWKDWTANLPVVAATVVDAPTS